MAGNAVEQLTGGGRGKIVSVRQAVRLIQPNDTVAIHGFGYAGVALELIDALADLYENSQEEGQQRGRPHDLTITLAASPGDMRTGGANKLATPGLIKRIIGGHFSFVPALTQLITSGQIEGYNLPLGTLSQLYRDIGAGKPGHLSRVGLGTFIDPRFGGGRLNERSTEQLVELMSVGGEEYLFYKTFPINVTLLRATTADEDGNLTMEREPSTLDAFPMALAAHNSGGLVIAQVQKVAQRGSLDPREVKVPGVLVDCVVESSNIETFHRQTPIVAYDPGLSAEVKVLTGSVEPLPMGPRKIIARRAALELRPNSVVNLGVGMPEGVSAVAAEEKVSDLMTLTAESGIIGGVPAGGLNFGTGVNPQAVIDMAYQFDLYDGGGLDCTFLGLAQADAEGNLNVSQFGSKLAGCGGFINISQNAKKVVFMGTFTVGRMEASIVDGKVVIDRDGAQPKFVQEVEQRTFSGSVAAADGMDVIYITERCVFRLTSQGLELIEVAPGIDIEKDIVAKMEFRPIINEPREMDRRIFRADPMGLRDELLTIPVQDRVSYDDESNEVFLNFESLRVRDQATIDTIAQEIHSALEPLGHKVFAVVNYDNFEIDPELEDCYADRVSEIGAKYFHNVTRFSTSAFMRAKLGKALQDRGVAPHIYESADEARTAVRDSGLRSQS